MCKWMVSLPIYIGVTVRLDTTPHINSGASASCAYCCAFISVSLFTGDHFSAHNFDPDLNRLFVDAVRKLSAHQPPSIFPCCGECSNGCSRQSTCPRVNSWLMIQPSIQCDRSNVPLVVTRQLAPSQANSPHTLPVQLGEWRGEMPASNVSSTGRLHRRGGG